MKGNGLQTLKAIGLFLLAVCIAGSLSAVNDDNATFFAYLFGAVASVGFTLFAWDIYESGRESNARRKLKRTKTAAREPRE